LPPVNHVRRKPSFHGRAHINSSDEVPSLNDSIYEAYHISNTNSEETIPTPNLESWLTATVHGLNLPTSKVRNTTQNTFENRVHAGDENSSPLPASSDALAVGDTSFRYGKGTTLSTITEKKSTGTIATMDCKVSCSLSSNYPRRKKSFSTGDIAPVSGSYHKVISMIENQTQPIREVYAEPKFPLTDPPIRASTPPGMPSWEQHQRGRTHTYGAQKSRPNLFRRIFAVPASSRLTFTSNSTDSTPRTNPTMTRFRPPRSAYGPINQHPFHRAPTAKPCVVPEQALGTATAANPAIGLELRQTQPRCPGRSKTIGKRKSGLSLTLTPTAAPLAGSITVRTNIDGSTAYQPIPTLSHLAFIPPPSYILPKQKPCTHRFGQKSLSAPGHPTSSRCSQYEQLVEDRPFLEPLSHPWRSRSPSRQSSEGAIPDPRAFENIDSISSSTHLMTGAISPGLPPSPPFDSK